MRINPLLAPLMVVLALPFALGIANTASITGTHHLLFGPGGPGGPLPQCKSCTVGTTIQKQQSISDLACGYSSNGVDPYVLQTGTCQRYTCTNGFYYTFSGWTTQPTCVSNQQTATSCPTATCSPG